jgi:hypothetical protein
VAVAAAGASAKIVAFVALVPNAFAIIVSLFTLLLIIWRRPFHFIISEILIRCVEKSPFFFISGIIGFVTGVLAVLAHELHFTDFL